MPCVANNPDWWVLEIFDGHGSHVNNLHVSEVQEKHRIIAAKEEADSSNVNQAHDNNVAHADKAFLHEHLALFRKAKSFHKGTVLQWDLTHVVLAAIFKTKPERWTSSFDACDLDPQTRTSFLDWCKKIE
jgi:hypothetical protein